MIVFYPPPDIVQVRIRIRPDSGTVEIIPGRPVMLKFRSFIIKFAQGALMLIASSILPLAAHSITHSGGTVFIAWLVQLALIAAALVFFRKKVESFIWLIIVAASPIIMMPVIGSHSAYLALAVLPSGMVEITKESLPLINYRANTVLVAQGARVKTSGEIRYSKTEKYQVEDRHRPGQYLDKTSTTEYRFVPVFWADQGEGDAFALIEYNNQVQETFKSEAYSIPEDEPEKLPVLYLVPGGRGLRGEASLTFREPGRSPGYGLAADFIPAMNAFTSEGEMRSFIRARLPLPVIFFLLVLTGFVVIPALYIVSRKK
jgi:hypothetical protein